MDRALGVLSMVLVAIAALAFAREMISLPGVLSTVADRRARVRRRCGAGLYSERVASLALGAAARCPGQKAKRLGTASGGRGPPLRGAPRAVTVVLIASVRSS